MQWKTAMNSQRLVEHCRGTDRTKPFLVLVPVLLLVLLFVSSPVKPEIEAEIAVRGLNRSDGVRLVPDEGRDVSIQWLSEEEAVVRLTASRDDLLSLYAGGEQFPFTLHDLVIFKTKAFSTGHVDIHMRMTSGKVVRWYANLLEEFHAVLFDNRFVIAVLIAFSAGFVYLRNRPRFRHLVPYWVAAALLTYQVLYLLGLTPTLYWDTPLSDPYVRTCFLIQIVATASLLAVWLASRRMLAGSRPSAVDFMDRIIDRYGLLILILISLLQHGIGHLVFGYNLQPPDARWSWLVWAERMLDQGIVSWLSGGTLRGLDPPMVSLLWALMYRVIHDKYLVSALLPMLFSQIAIISTFSLARQLFDRRVGFYAALFLALSPLFSFQGYFVSTDVPSVALTILTLSLFLAAVRRESLPLAAVSGFCLLLTVAVKLTGLYCALLIVLAWFFLSRRNIKVLFTTLSFLLLFPVMYWGPLLLTEGFDATTVAGAAGHLWTWMKLAMFVSGKERPADWNYLLFQSGQVHHYMGPSSMFFYFQYLVNAVGFPIFLWAMMIPILLMETWWRGLRERRRRILGDKQKLLLLTVWILTLLAFLSPWLMRNTRFSFLAFPAYAILAGYGFILFKKRALSECSGHSYLLLSLTAIILVTQSLAHYYSFPILVNHKYRDPLFVETTDAYYCVHRHHGGWHVCWSGGGTSHPFAGELATDGRFVDITPFDLERADSLEISESQDRISFQGSSRLGRDGFDFQIEEGNWISLDLLIDGVRYPERVYVYTGTIAVRQDEATTLPLTFVWD